MRKVKAKKVAIVVVVNACILARDRGDDEKNKETAFIFFFSGFFMT